MTTMIVDDLGRIPMSPYLTATLTRAADYATAQQHREVTLEHLLLALAEDPEATVVLKSSHIDLARLSAEVSDFLGRSEDHVDPAGGQTVAISADLRRILEAAAAAAKQGRRREINGAIVLAAIVGDGKSTAAQLLRVQGLTFEEAIRALQRAAPPAPPPPQPAPAASHPAPTPPRPAPPPPTYPTTPPQPDQEPEREEAEPRPRPDFGAPPPPDLTRPASTEEILASARERLQPRPTDMGRPDIEHPDTGRPHDGERPDAGGRAERPPSSLTRTNYPDLGGPPQPAPMAPPEPPFEREPPAAERTDEHPSDDLPSLAAERPGTLPGARHERDVASWPIPSARPGPGAHPLPPSGPQPQPSPAPDAAPGTRWHTPASTTPAPAATGSAAPPAERRRAAPSGPFVGSWPLIESGQLIENIPRRMRVGVAIVAEARIARADVKALAEGLQGGGAAFRHEVVVTKAMSVRLRAPDGGFTIENRSPETQWIENVLGFGSDDFASWRWTVTPRARGRRPLQLIVSARTVGADGMTAETALPDQIVDVKVSINYARTLARWTGWIAAAVIGGLLAKFGETGWVIAQLLIAKHLGG
jgi:hypothetical protein